MDQTRPNPLVEAESFASPLASAGEPGPSSFLARLQPADRDFLLRESTSRVLPADAVLFHHGDPSAFTIFLISGWVKVSTGSHRGHETLLALRGPGDVVGELAALDGRPRSATVQTLTPVHAAIVPAQRFMSRLRERPDIAIALLGHVAERLRDSDSRRLGFGAHTVPERLAAYLVELAHRHGTVVDNGTQIDVPLSQRELAGAVGASREAVARCLRILRDRRVVITSRRRVTVLQLDVLAAMAKNVQDDTQGRC